MLDAAEIEYSVGETFIRVENCDEGYHGFYSVWEFGTNGNLVRANHWE